MDAESILLRCIGVSGSGYNEVLALEVLNVVDCVE